MRHAALPGKLFHHEGITDNYGRACLFFLGLLREIL